MYKDNINEIEKVITKYFEGIFHGDADKLSSCFNNDAIIYGDINGVPYKKSREEYIDGVKNRQSPNELEETFQMKTIGIDILGNIAMVKLRVPMLGYNYYDYLSLTKVDHDWKIVNKIFTNVV
ncbi:nuclear transport factor 2 family protein [Aquimarina litoralis]|uniref:nuclear transport factor 2 family protein n=1 Tax=Aquimarina litoralis TaxID=584605 RepID=UPI001C59FEA7|nr:nuclear transport factor 2 family protein [Aquimarina litoralis]MBW1295696.1 nuclear transport factor 2 family protein [Aquimarina litoralis]